MLRGGPLIINTDASIAGKYGAHSAASQEAKAIYDESTKGHHSEKCVYQKTFDEVTKFMLMFVAK